MSRSQAPILDRLVAQIQFGDCWEWTGYRNEKGYGLLRVGGKSGKLKRVHRLAYELSVGPIPDDLEIDHLCRNRACCNPDHLEPVTRRENQLRGEGPGGKNARKTHCPQGHEYDGVIRLGGQLRGRRCLTCHRDRERGRKRKGDTSA